jgi:hypothetical protein
MRSECRIRRRALRVVNRQKSIISAPSVELFTACCGELRQGSPRSLLNNSRSPIRSATGPKPMSASTMFFTTVSARARVSGVLGKSALSAAASRSGQRRTAMAVTTRRPRRKCKSSRSMRSANWWEPKRPTHSVRGDWQRLDYFFIFSTVIRRSSSGGRVVRSFWSRFRP